MNHRNKLWTPGPWGYGSSNGLSGDVISWGCYLDDTECHELPVHNDKEAICVIYFGNPSGPHKANAQLISAAPDLVDEHEDWAKLLGEVYVLVQQADYSEAMRLMNQSLTIDFKANNGAPAALSAALDKAYGDDSQ